MSELNEIECGQLCQTTIESLYEVTGGLTHFPGLLRKIIKNKAWKRRVAKGKVIELESLRELITKEPIEGWGEDPKKVEAVIKDTPDVLAMYRDEMYEAMANEPGNPTGNNQHTDRNCASGTIPHGSNQASTIIRRLKRDRPDIAEGLANGEYRSARQAAIAAGIIKPPTPLETARKAIYKLTDEEFAQLLSEINEIRKCT